MHHVFDRLGTLEFPGGCLDGGDGGPRGQELDRQHEQLDDPASN